jgi:sulfatase modifying factor 1
MTDPSEDFQHGVGPPPYRGGGRGRRQLAKHAAALLTLIALSLASSAGNADKPDIAREQNSSLVPIPAGSFESVLPAEKTKRVDVNAFRLDETPVTNAQFAAFVAKHPEWRRDRVARVFADEQYLQHWASPTQPAKDQLNRPVVHVSWFAASAYCESRGARLPTWYEWEYAAAASETKQDARSDPEWRQRILDWYSRSAREGLPNVGATPANIYGVRDLHAVVWEWVEDLSALLVASDSREQGDPDQMRFCGAGAITMEQKENYAMLMRVAMLSGMKASYSTATMGFRCAVDGGTP